MKYQAMLLIKSGDQLFNVAPCKIDEDGGVFTSKQFDRENPKKKIISFERIGTVDMEKVLESIDDGKSDDDGTSN